MNTKLHEQAHEDSSRHREEVKSSDRCGCFYCGETFPPSEINEWTEGNTAICPKCGIDSVIGSNSGYDLSDEFLDAMYERWFGRTVSYGELFSEQDKRS